MPWTTKGQCPRGDEYGMKHDPKKQREPKRKGTGSRPSSAPQRSSLGRGTGTRQCPSAEENQPTCFACKKVIVQERVLVITGIHLRVSFINNEIASLGEKCALKHTEKASGEPSREYNHSEKHHCEGSPSARRIRDSNEINFTENWEEYGHEVPSVSLHRTICEKSERRKVQPWELNNKVDRAVEVRLLCLASNSEGVQIY